MYQWVSTNWTIEADRTDLANHLLTQLAVKHELASTRDGDKTSLFEQLIPRLLTAVFLQQDLDGVLRRVLGDDAAQPIRELSSRHRIKLWSDSSLTCRRLHAPSSPGESVPV